MAVDIGDGMGYRILDAIADPVIVMSAVRDAGEIVELRYDYVNRAAASNMALEPSEIVGRGMLELFPSHRQLGLFEAYCSIIGASSPRRVEVPWFEEGAVRGAWEVMLSPMGDGFVATIIDLSERKHGIDEVQVRHAQLQMLLDHAGDLTFFTVDETINFVSPSLAVLLGWNPAELIERPIETLVHPDDVEQLQSRREILRSTGYAPMIRFQVLRGDGGRHWVDSMARVVADPRYPGQLCVAGLMFDVQAEVEALEQARRDRQNRRQMEIELQQRQRLESLGLLAGGIAHDLNNLLGVIRMGTDLVRRGVAADSDTNADLDNVDQAVDRIAELTGQLLDYARQRSADPVRLDLADILDETLSLLKSSWPTGVSLSSNIARPLPVNADRARITQVLMNLLLNAAQACDSGGGVTVSAHAVDGGDAGADRSSPNLSSVHVVVADTGKGISAAQLERIFDPFYTTKPDGRGLGLSVVQGVVEQLGGSIDVISAEHAGTTFTVLLPSADQKPSAQR